MDRSNFYRNTWVEIDLDAIFNNVQEMKSHLQDNVDIIAVVKANGYGHGDVQVAKTALEAGATYLAVAFLDEALTLRKKGITAPILVLGASRPQDLEIAAKNQLTLTVFQAEWLREAKQNYELDASISFHLKMDSGMGRIGIRDEVELNEIVKMIQDDARFSLQGVYTHFATADEKNVTYFNQQYERFLEMLDWFSSKPKMIHCANSATGLRFPSKVFNVVRFGIAMYGLTPSIEIKDSLPFQLSEAFSFHSRLVHVKKVSAGEKISYGTTYTAEKDEWIGTVPVGYADGWIRKLQNFDVLINGKRAQIIGRICMDQFMIRLNEKLPYGTKVTLIGCQKNECNSIDEVAKYLDTINYEISCMISYRVPRMFLKNMSIIEVSNAVLNNH